MPTAKAIEVQPRVSASKQSAMLRDEQLKEIGVTEETDSFFGSMVRDGDDDGYEPTKDPVPTGSRQGTIERVKVLAARLLAGEALEVFGDNMESATPEERLECIRWINDLREETLEEKRLAKERKEQEQKRIERNAKAKQVREQKNGGKQKPIRISKEVLKAWKQK
jgi:hypothetical protein